MKKKKETEKGRKVGVKTTNTTSVNNNKNNFVIAKVTRRRKDKERSGVIKDGTIGK